MKHQQQLWGTIKMLNLMPYVPSGCLFISPGSSDVLKLRQLEFMIIIPMEEDIKQKISETKYKKETV